jgi:glycosyltransferase involved in cell wall biosynthesis
MELKGKFDRSVSMLAWGYNEEELVEGFLDRAFALLEKTVSDYELVFVDDCSTDRTGEILADYANREPKLRVITHEKNLNVGFACRRAVAEARKEFLFWQTVDWSYDLTYLRIFLELLKYFDVVQGIRPAPERLLSHIPIIRSIYRIKSRSDNLQKAVVSLSNYYLLRLLYGVKFHDFQNITFYPTALAQSLTIVGKTSFVNPEFLLKAHARGAHFLEVPIGFIPRQAGVAKGTKLRTIVRSVRDVFGNWFDWGMKLRLDRRRAGRPDQIFRVSQPVHLDKDVLEIVIPLFKCYR